MNAFRGEVRTRSQNLSLLDSEPAKPTGGLQLEATSSCVSRVESVQSKTLIVCLTCARMHTSDDGFGSTVS